jgi:DNA-binding beta-propeller fold protein YncE
VVHEPWDHAGKTGSVIDPATLTFVAVIPLGGQPEYSQVDPTTGSVYQNLEDTNELVVIDLQKATVTRRYPLVPGTGPTGLASMLRIAGSSQPVAAS